MTVTVRQVSDETVDLIRHFEGFVPNRYLDAAGLPTIGIGHLIKAGETFSEPMSEDEAGDLLRRDLRTAKYWVTKLISVPVSDGQYGALVSFTFNLGSGNLQRSTLRMKVNREDHLGAVEEFPKWRRAGGRILKGLVRRRAAEVQLYLS